MASESKISTIDNSPLFLREIQTQHSDTLNYQNSHIAESALTFKAMSHTNAFDDLIEEWEDFREEEGKEEDGLLLSDELAALTAQKTTDEPETVEMSIMERHVREMLYNLLLASHYHMNNRKKELMQKLMDSSGKRSEIIAEYLPRNKETMQPVIAQIFDEIVQKHYYKCIVFIDPDLGKDIILKYIKSSCKLSFEMLIAQNELSFYPLSFVDSKSQCIQAVCRYDRIIKKREKELMKSLSPKSRSRSKTHSKTASLSLSFSKSQTNAYLSVLKNKEFKAKAEVTQGEVIRDATAGDADKILYYSFPGVIKMEDNKVLKKAIVFTHGDPSIFLSHDLNWIFNEKARKPHAEESENVFSSHEQNMETDPYAKIAHLAEVGQTMDTVMEKIADNNDVINSNFLSKAQLLLQWKTLKQQKHLSLCEDICDLIVEQNENDTDYEENKDEEMEEFRCNAIASGILWDLTMKCKEAMKLKMKVSSIGKNKHNISYLNMHSIYKNLTNYKETKEIKDVSQGYRVKSIISSVFDAIIVKGKKYRKYEFLNEKLSKRLHEYIAMCCELICNIIHHQWQLCPIPGAKNKSLQRFDDRIHIRDEDLSMEEATDVIGYCCFPGVITKGCWNQFDIQYTKGEIDDQKKIDTFIKAKMWVCLKKE